MSVVGFKAKNHPQQVDSRGALDEVDDRGTHPDDFKVWDERFGGFTLDAAAAPHNAKVAKFYTRADDGLDRSWAGEKVWCNPPYSDLYSWVAKAWREWRSTYGIVMLLPANRVEQKWWQELVEPVRDRWYSPLHVEFLKGRLRFIKAGQTDIGPNERPPFGCALLVWDAPRHGMGAAGAMEPKDIAARLTGDIFDAVPDDNDMQHVLSLASAALKQPALFTPPENGEER